MEMFCCEEAKRYPRHCGIMSPRFTQVKKAHVKRVHDALLDGAFLSYYRSCTQDQQIVHVFIRQLKNSTLPQPYSKIDCFTYLMNTSINQWITK